jgi:tRNA splicing endonuclease
MKILKKFESFSRVNENSGVKTTQEVIEKYKEMPGLWNMARDQYYNVITGNEMALKEIEEFYPNWTIEDFKEVYLAMEGELPDFNEAAKVEKTSKKDEIEDFIGKNKKNKSSYEMYKVLREKGYTERDLKDYFYDNY